MMRWSRIGSPTSATPAIRTGCIREWYPISAPAVGRGNRRLPHHPPELLEQVARVVRAGGGFGVVLHAEDRLLDVAKAFEGLVVQVDVRRLDVLGQRLRVDGKAVVLGGDFDLLGAAVENG